MELEFDTVLYPRMLIEKIVLENVCTDNRKNGSLMRIRKQSLFKSLEEIQKAWTAARVGASKATTHTYEGHGLQLLHFLC